MVYPEDGQSWLVTAAARTAEAGAMVARTWAARLSLPYVRRGNQSWTAMTRAHGHHSWLVCHPNEGLRARTGEGRPWRWHPGLAKTRLQAGAEDPLLRALDLGQGARVVDANLGQAHDALILLGAGMRVHGLERHPVVHALTTDGLRRSAWAPGEALTSEVIDHGLWLSQQPAASWDAVVFSPMFVRPEFDAEDLVQLREVAHHGWPSAEILSDAARVADVVVIKLERDRFPALPWRAEFSGGRRRVVYARLARDSQGALIPAS